MPLSSTLRTECTFGFWIMRHKRRFHFRAYFKCPWAYGWSQPGHQGVAGQPHSGDQIFQNATTQAAPACVSSCHGSPIQVTEHNRQTICRKDSAGVISRLSPACIRIRNTHTLCWRKADNVSTVDLVEPHE